MKLVKKEVGHGVTVERYEANKKPVILMVFTNGVGNAETHYRVLTEQGESGDFYKRETAMKFAESMV